MQLTSRVLTIIIINCFCLMLFGQNVAKSDLPTPQISPQIIQRIFDEENRMINTLTQMRPVFEVYEQSLWTYTQAEIPIDDAYLLSTVDFGSRLENDKFDNPRGAQTILFGRQGFTKLRTEDGDKWAIHADGFPEVLFVDIDHFNEQTYTLAYMGKDPATSLLHFLVVPLDKKIPRFHGTIWVEEQGYKIVRIKGQIGPPLRQRLYKRIGPVTWGGDTYHPFEAWRIEISPGCWFPYYAQFDDSRDVNGNKEEDNFRYRGQIFMWGFSTRPPIPPTNISLLSVLQDANLLASPGVVEDDLNALVRNLIHGQEQKTGQIVCRVLFTAPIDIFAVDHTVFISRGLLNLVPSNVVLNQLLAHEIAHIILGETHPVDPGFRRASIFDPRRTTDFSGFGWHHDIETEKQASILATLLLKNAGLPADSQDASDFVASLWARANQIPNLLQARFGPSLKEEQLSSAPINKPKMIPIQFRSAYVVNPATNEVDETSVTSEKILQALIAHGSAR